MNANFNRVFFHELGHYVAHKLIFKNLGISDAESIEIHKHPYASDEYTGGVTPVLPPDRSRTDYKIVNLAEFLTTSVYGCIFETLYIPNSFSLCFSDRGHGDNDCLGVFGKYNALDQHQLRHKGVNLMKLFTNHLTVLENSHLFEDIRNLDIETLITPISETTHRVDVNLLDALINDFMNSIQPIFLDFIQEIRDEIAK